MDYDRDGFLSEKMGICYHSNASPFGKCPDCGAKAGNDPLTRDRIDFSTWEGFGELWVWFQFQLWAIDFLKERTLICGLDTDNPFRKGIIAKLGLFGLIHPDRFADELYDYLKEKDNVK